MILFKLLFEFLFINVTFSFSILPILILVFNWNKNILGFATMRISYLINAFFIYKLSVQILCQYLHVWNLTKPSVNLALEFNFSIRNCTTCTCTQYNLLFGQERGYKKKLLAPSWFHGAKQRARAKACNSVEFVDTLIWVEETDFRKSNSQSLTFKKVLSCCG